MTQAENMQLVTELFRVLSSGFEGFVCEKSACALVAKTPEMYPKLAVVVNC